MVPSICSGLPQAPKQQTQPTMVWNHWTYVEKYFSKTDFVRCLVTVAEHWHTWRHWSSDHSSPISICTVESRGSWPDSFTCADSLCSPQWVMKDVMVNPAANLTDLKSLKRYATGYICKGLSWLGHINERVTLHVGSIFKGDRGKGFLLACLHNAFLAFWSSSLAPFVSVV